MKSNKAGFLSSVKGLEGCLFAHTNPPGVLEVSPFYCRRRSIPIQVPSARNFNCHSSVHKLDGNRGSSYQEAGSSAYPIFRQQAESQVVKGRIFGRPSSVIEVHYQVGINPKCVEIGTSSIRRFCVKEN